jgi:hypothetical protein
MQANIKQSLFHAKPGSPTPQAAGRGAGVS